MIPEEVPPAGTLPRLTEYLMRMFRNTAGALVYLNDNVLSLWDWTNDHVEWTAPDYLEDPHPQYHHMVNDNAFAHIAFENLTTPKVVSVNNVITGYDRNVVTDYQLTSDLAAGTITVPAGVSGFFYLAVSFYLAAEKNTTYVISAYINGVETGQRFPIVLGAQVVDAHRATSGIFEIPPGVDTAVLDLRYSFSSVPANDISIYHLNMSLHRQIGEVPAEIIGGIDSFPLPDQIPPGWDPSNPGMPP